MAVEFGEFCDKDADFDARHCALLDLERALLGEEEDARLLHEIKTHETYALFPPPCPTH